jgi:DNA-binding GntR family transcriptional regulator
LVRPELIDGPPLKKVGGLRRTLGDLAYKELLDAILYRRLVPGESLGLDRLATQLGMSRTPVNLALSRLYAEGLVSYNEHTGFVVRTLTVKELDEIYDLRLLYEIHAVEVGLRSSSEAQLDEIAALAEQFIANADWEGPDVYRRALEFDYLFHRSILRLAGSALLEEAYDRLHYPLQSFRLGLVARQRRPVEQVIAEHTAIVAALAEHDVGAAQARLRLHIEGARDRALERLDALG